MIYKTEAIAKEFELYLTQKILSYDKLPELYVIQIGDDFASNRYIKHKKQKCDSLELNLVLKKFDFTVDPIIVENYIKSVSITKPGIIIQLPVPAKFKYLIDTLDSKCDVDLLAPHSELYESYGFLTPTIGAIDITLKKILNSENIVFKDLMKQKLDLSQKKVAVIGQGKLVGKPLLSYLLARGATIISINKNTKSPQLLTNLADIVISAAGAHSLVNKDWIGENTIVIDAATVELDGTLIGDVDKSDINQDTVLCPSPGGIGRLTILYLIYNLLIFSKTF
ncbi:MAG: bifunctional 5,10-methylenetetrahydrofolate dehydrogenase/5,10-methenyltetrahydrofolate cyclohydrolase [candidate division SR1 bacterium]|nr:bifunctional 5,10-methylenetetrahydrofolate dehydrogenase/5,10-methenyltetrahydrofolate cyclohydrolase [candidate division SR1 bacterium]